MEFGSPSPRVPNATPNAAPDFWFPARISHDPVRAPRRRRMDRRAAFLLALDYLESRLLMAGTPARLIVPTLQDPLTSVGAVTNPPIKVTVVDVTGATVTTDTSTVVLTLLQNPAGGSLTVNGRAVGSVTAAAVAGVATFSNLSFSIAGQYVINVNDGLLAGASSNLFTVLPTATHLVFQAQPGSVSAGVPFAPAVQVLVEDATNNIVTTDTRTITLSLNSTAGSLTGTAAVHAVNGIATFTGLAVSTPGSFSLTAKDNATSGALTSVTSSPFTVTAGAAAKLLFQTPPANTAQSSILSPVVVDVTDASGFLVNTDTSAVTLNLYSANGDTLTLVGTTTVNAVGGVATFNDLTITQLGRFRLQAVDGALTNATASVATWGAPSQVDFQTNPTGATVNSTMSSFTVAVEDANGVIVGTDNSAVTVNVLTGSGTLSGTTTVSAVNGVATFTGLSLSAVGTYTLNASDAGLTNHSSNSFIINGTAAQLTFLVLPGATEANANLSPAVIVEVEDIFGNRVVNDSSQLRLSINSGPSSTLSGTPTATAVNGTASFSGVKIPVAGTYTLAVSDTTFPSVTPGISGNILILPAASQLVFSQQPSNVASGSSMYPAVVVQVQNSLGNVATTNTSQVTLVLLSGPRNGTIGGTTTVSAVAGVATFSALRFGVPGTYQIMAIDGSLGTAISRTFVVTRPASQLQWAAQPVGPIPAGQSLNNMTIWVEDWNKNVVNSDHSVATLAISSGPAGGTITGNTTANALNGLVTFAGISFTKVGTYILTVTDGTLTAALSKKFDVVADKATTQMAVVAPTSIVAGKTITGLAIEIVDQFGNILVHDSSRVALSIESGPVGGALVGTKTVQAKNGVATFTNLSINEAGSYTFTVIDNQIANIALGFALTVNPQTTTVSVPAHAASYNKGQAFTLTTQLKNLQGAALAWTGTVTLVSAANTVVSTGTLSTGGKVTLPVAGQSVGTYNLHVVYSGDTNHLGTVSAPFSLVVGPGTTTQVTASSRQVVTGSTITLSALVGATKNSPPRTGIATLMEGATVVGTLSLDGSSKALFSVAPTVGTHLYTVVYAGDSNFRSSTSALVSIKVVQAGSTLQLTQPEPLTITSSTTLHLTVTAHAAAGVTLVPTGTVQLKDNGVVIGSLTLSGSASGMFTLSPGLGIHHYQAIYLGDSNFKTSFALATETVQNPV